MIPPAPIRNAAERRGTPLVSHIAALPGDWPGREVIAPALEIVAREIDSLAVSFFSVAGGEISSSVVSGSSLPPHDLVRRVRGWKLRLRGIEPLAPARIAALPRRIATPRDLERGMRPRHGELRRLYRELGVVNDLRLLIRDGGRLVSGITVWRRFGERSWAPDRLRPLEALQPLIERAYLQSRRRYSSAAHFPPTLTSRQRQVAELLADGARNADVARALHISPNTVKSHTREVFAALGVSSRRELAMRRAPEPAALASIAAEQANAELGDPADALLASVLEWSENRIGAALGGCVLLSSRGEPVAEAWDRAPQFRQVLDPQLPQSVHELILEPAREARVLRDAERAPWSVSRLDAKAGDAAVRVFELLGGVGLTMPTLLTLRRRGRLAGLLWLCREAGAAIGQAEAESLLRAVQPLLEGSIADRGPGRHILGGPDIASRGLSARELTVARLALAGEDNAAIAARLGIAEGTVKKHVTRILAKCEVRSRTELIATLTAVPPSGDFAGIRTTNG